MLVFEALGHVTIDDAQGEAFDDGRLADTGLTNQDRIVLGAARQHLDGAADFLVTADHRVELALARRLGQVARVFFQRLVGFLGGLAVSGSACAHVVGRLIEGLGRDAGLLQRFRSLGAGLER